MIRISGITNDQQLKRNVSINELNLSEYKMCWIDFNSPTEVEINHLEQTFHFHPLAIEDCVYRLQRPKLDYYDDYTFYVTQTVREGSKDVSKDELNFFIGDNYIVSYHQEQTKEVEDV